MDTTGPGEWGPAGSSTLLLEGCAHFLLLSLSYSLMRFTKTSFFVFTSFSPWKIRQKIITFVKPSWSPHPFPEQELNTALCWLKTLYMPVLWMVWNSEHMASFPLRLLELWGGEPLVHIWNSASSTQEVFSESLLVEKRKENRQRKDKLLLTLPCVCCYCLHPGFCSLLQICQAA